MPNPTLERHFGAQMLTRSLPWNTPPSGQGARLCAWCDRTIYRPAEPCSVTPIADIAALVHPPGPGDRCLWEMRTRGLLGGDRRPPNPSSRPRERHTLADLWPATASSSAAMPSNGAVIACTTSSPSAPGQLPDLYRRARSNPAPGDR